MSYTSSLARQGLFGSQARPGMNPAPKKPKRLGSLSGSSLGDDTPQTADAIFPDTAGPAMAAANSASAAAKSARNKRLLMVGGAVVLAYLIFGRKSSASAAPAAPSVPAVV